MKKKRYEDSNSTSVQDRVVDIHELSNNLENPDLRDSYLKLEQKADAMSKTIDELVKALELKEDEIIQLKNMLNKSIPTVGSAIDMILSDEEVIADIQLRKLKDSARTRELTLDEIRKFDLLVKNKRLAQGNATTIDGQAKNIKQLNQTELLKIASKKIESR